MDTTPAAALRRLPTLPTSDSAPSLFRIGPTQHAGFAAFATSALDPGTLVLESPSPAALVIFRYFRKEVCARCFAYDRGRQWKVRDNRCGVVFCGTACQAAWADDHPESARDALAAVESFLQARMLKVTKKSKEEVRVRKVAANIQHWQDAEETANLIRSARATSAGKATKAQRRAVRESLDLPLEDPDILPFVLSGILTMATNGDLWEQYLSLVPHRQPYPSTAALESTVNSYLILLAILPISLLPLVSSEIVQGLIARDACNSFGIWSTVGTRVSATESHDEFLGYGIWPSASFFNHSCSPTVHMDRIGRSLQFRSTTQGTVADGGELCICYLGLEGEALDVQTRRKKLLDGWDFLCTCPRCTADAGE